MTQILCTCNCSALQRCTALLVCYWFHCICCVGLENVLNVFACVCVCVCLLTARAWIMASLTFKATHNEVPPYLARLLTPYCPSRVLRSSFSSNLLQVVHTNLIFGSRSFRAAAPTVCNSLPGSIRSSGALKMREWKMQEWKKQE